MDAAGEMADAAPGEMADAAVEIEMNSRCGGHPCCPVGVDLEVLNYLSETVDLAQSLESGCLSSARE